MAQFHLDTTSMQTIAKKALGHDATVESSRIENFSATPLGFLAKHELLILSIRKNCQMSDQSPPERHTFFLKTMPEHYHVPPEYFETEVEYFSKLIPIYEEHVKIPRLWYPKCYLARQKILVFEDLRAQGYEVVEGLWSLYHFKVAIRCIARCHASSIVAQQKLQKPLSSTIPPRLLQEKFFVTTPGDSWTWLKTGMEAAEALAQDLGFKPGLVEAGYQLAIATRDKLRTEDIRVIGHFDLWTRNVMFKSKSDSTDDLDDCRLVDFQIANYGCPVLDLAQLFYLNGNAAFLKEHEKMLIELYHSEVMSVIANNGIDNDGTIFMSLTDLFEEFEKKRICGLVVAAQCLPIGCLNNRFLDEYSDEKNINYVSYENRTDFFRRAIEEDNTYKTRILEIIRLLGDYMMFNSR